jgi:hypothetical protein
MRIHCDPDDIVSVNVRKGNETNSKSIELNNGTADIRMDRIDLKGVGRIAVVFKSKKYGDIEYVDGPVSIDRYLHVNCYNGRVVIKVERTGYL